METFKPRLDLKKEVRFFENLAEKNLNSEEHFGDLFGGIIKSGQWGWLTKGTHLRINSLRTGQLISQFDFGDCNGFGVCIITCISEVHLPYHTDTIIAVGIQYADCPGGLAVIYSIEESKVIRCIELKHKITCCKFISHELSQHTVLQNMNGCLALGTDSGSVLLVDLNLRLDGINLAQIESGVSVIPCHIVDYSMNLLHLHRHFLHCQKEGVHFGIQLEVLENAKFIQSLLPIDRILSLAVGLADGRLVLYDLTDMQVFYVAPPQEKSSPLVKMSFMEPPDDPRSCIYVWCFHENYQNSMAVLHSLMYEKRVIADHGFCFFENYQAACVRLLVPLDCPQSIPITCQSITKPPSHGNEQTISLCALVWKQEKEQQTDILIFDINQWYKEEMPYVGDWREDPSYLAYFMLPDLSSLEMFFNPNTISLFNSIQRPEEHFYPVSLSFDCIALGETGCVHMNWPGAQNRCINMLRNIGPIALLDPNPVFNEILNTRLLPQFTGLNYKSSYSLKAKREAILSVALEQNCIGLLKECARNWADGSHQWKSLEEGLTLSTLTNWVSSRASIIKERCNNLCQVLFDLSGCTLSQREQKELGYISKQLKILADLPSEILIKFSANIPSDVLNALESQSKSIRMISEYQEILLWLLNIGLLPEASRLVRHRELELNLVPYPYESLKRFYKNRREEFVQLNEKFVSRKTQGCYLLFIDSFIEHEFKGNNLRDCWQESGGDGLYPPTSLQAMLRIMLIQDVSFENKCALFLYFFLDLNMAIEEKQYEPIVQNFIKFPSVFKLSASLIKQIQAFWNLDHCRFLAAVDEFISPFNKDQVCPQWQLELFLESLLAQNEANLALRVLEAKSSSISPLLQLNTYLANDLISEAFHFARSKQDEDLLKLFFTGCLCTGKFGVIRDLALTESEGNLVQTLLKNSKSRNAESLHFVYLLEKYKYLEAVSYLDELSKGKMVQRVVDVDTPTLVLSAYNSTMTPVIKGLSDVYFKIKDRIKTKKTEENSPYPLSCQLIKHNANDLLGGIYHSSALSAHFASHYWERHQSEKNTLQQSKNAPFLRRPQISSFYSEYNQKESISYPDPYKVAQKRRLDSNSVEEERMSKMRENPKKRRKIYDFGMIYKPLNQEQQKADSLLAHQKNVSTYTQGSATLARDNAIFLETPYVKDNNSEDNSSNVSSCKIPEKSATPLQSILKISQPNFKSSSIEQDPNGNRTLSVEFEKRDKKDTDEEKSIRFILPTAEDESLEEVDEENVSMESEEVVELPQLLNKYTGPARRKSLRGCSNYIPTYSGIGLNSPFKYKYSSEADTVNKEFADLNKNTVRNEVEKDIISSDAGKKLRSISTNIYRDDDTTVEEENESNAKPHISLNEPGWGSENDHSEKLLQNCVEDAKENTKVISVAFADENYSFSTTNLDEIAKLKSQKRSLSVSSGENSSDSRSFKKKITTQLRGRASIHSFSNESPNTSLIKTRPKSTENIPKTDTIIDFNPHVSSSKVCASESKFNSNNMEIETKFWSEKTTSKVLLSECSTVVGGLTYLPITESTEEVNETNVTIQPRNKMLDTTVDMTLYDTIGFEKSVEKDFPNVDKIQSDKRNSEDELPKHALDDFDDQFSDSDDYDRASESIILLSSRSSSQAICDDVFEYEYESESDNPMTNEIVIDDEMDDNISDGINMLGEYSEASEDSINLSLNQFSEVTRTSTSCSAQSNSDVMGTFKAIEEDTNYENISFVDDSSKTTEENVSLLDEQEAVVTEVKSSTSEDSEKPENVIENEENLKLPPSVENKEQKAEPPSNIKKSEGTKITENAITKLNYSKMIIDGGEIMPNTVINENKTNKCEETDASQTESEPKIIQKAVIITKPEDNVPQQVLMNAEIINETETESDTLKKESLVTSIPKNPLISPQCEEEEFQNSGQEQTHKTRNERSKSVSKILTEEADNTGVKHSRTNDSIIKTQSEEQLQIVATQDHTPNTRSGRSKSVSQTLSDEQDSAKTQQNLRQSRGGSMPPTTTKQIITRRRSLLLETLTETTTPDSPSSRTRSKLRLDSVDGETESPSVSNMKRSRRSSISSTTSIEHPHTPKSRRRNSLTVEAEQSSTPKTSGTPRTTRGRSIVAEETTTPIKTPRRLSTSKKDNPSPDEMSRNTNELNESTEKEKVMEGPDVEPEISQGEDYTASRRLTRTQLAVLEKSAALLKQVPISPVRKSRRRPSRTNEKESPPSGDAKESDSESMSSKISLQSDSTVSRRVTRSSALKEHTEDDIISITSSTESGRKRRKRAKEATSPITLTAIPEEEPIGSEGSNANSESSKGTRRQKK